MIITFRDSDILSIAPADWKPTVLIFESDSSYVGREVNRSLPLPLPHLFSKKKNKKQRFMS